MERAAFLCLSALCCNLCTFANAQARLARCAATPDAEYGGLPVLVLKDVGDGPACCDVCFSTAGCRYWSVRKAPSWPTTEYCSLYNQTSTVPATADSVVTGRMSNAPNLSPKHEETPAGWDVANIEILIGASVAVAVVFLAFVAIGINACCRRICVGTYEHALSQQLVSLDDENENENDLTAPLVSVESNDATPIESMGFGDSAMPTPAPAVAAPSGIVGEATALCDSFDIPEMSEGEREQPEAGLTHGLI